MLDANARRAVTASIFLGGGVLMRYFALVIKLQVLKKFYWEYSCFKMLC